MYLTDGHSWNNGHAMVSLLIHRNEMLISQNYLLFCSNYRSPKMYLSVNC